MTTTQRWGHLQQLALEEGMHEVLEGKSLTDEKYDQEPMEGEPSA